MTNRTKPLITASLLLASGLLLAGCTNKPTPDATPSASRTPVDTGATYQPGSTPTATNPANIPLTASPTPTPGTVNLLTLTYRNNGQPLPDGNFFKPQNGFAYTATCTGPKGSKLNLNFKTENSDAVTSNQITCNTGVIVNSNVLIDLNSKAGDQVATSVTNSTADSFRVNITGR